MFWNVLFFWIFREFFPTIKLKFLVIILNQIDITDRFNRKSCFRPKGSKSLGNQTEDVEIPISKRYYVEKNFISCSLIKKKSYIIPTYVPIYLLTIEKENWRLWTHGKMQQTHLRRIGNRGERSLIIIYTFKEKSTTDTRHYTTLRHDGEYWLRREFRLVK